MFFCFVIGLGGIVSFIFNSFSGDFFEEYGGSIWLKAVDTSSGIIGLIMAGYVIYAIIKRKSNAVFFAKAYVVMVFVTNLILLLTNMTDESNYMTSMRRTVSSLIWGVIWFLYLTFSEQIKTRFPKNMRKVDAKDWFLALSNLYIPMTFLLLFWFGGDRVKVALRESVKELNSERTFTEGFDSVAYDEASNIYKYYFKCDNEDIVELLNRDESDFKTMLRYELQDDADSKEFLALLEKAHATLRYVYHISDGTVVRIVDISPTEMSDPVSAEQIRECALNMIEDEVREANGNCPQAIDQWVTLSSCTFDRQRVRMAFNYTVPYYKSYINRDVMDRVLEESRKNMIESISDNMIYKTAGLTIVIAFKDLNYDLIDYTTIGPNDY